MNLYNSPLQRSIWLGWDPRERDAFEVCVQSILQHLSQPIPIFAIDLEVLSNRGMYQRPTRGLAEDKPFDVISNAPMSTQFAISRFFVPHLVGVPGTALFMDCDMLVRRDLVELFDLADPQFAVQVVKHDYVPGEEVKMDGQPQTAYPRKNWSSVILWNLEHPATNLLTLQKLNTWAGRALHRFAWLEDADIGELPPEWNHLIGVYPPNPAAAIAHFTLGIPRMAGYEHCEFSQEWREIQQTAQL